MRQKAGEEVLDHLYFRQLDKAGSRCTYKTRLKKTRTKELFQREENGNSLFGTKRVSSSDRFHDIPTHARAVVEGKRKRKRKVSKKVIALNGPGKVNVQEGKLAVSNMTQQNKSFSFTFPKARRQSWFQKGASLSGH